MRNGHKAVRILLAGTVLVCLSTGQTVLGAGNAAQETPPSEREVPNRPPAPMPLPPQETAVLTNMVFRPVGAGVFELGKLRFSKPDRSITLPALVNSAGGPIEYFLVTTYGKTHESVLRTETEPMHLQLALLLLDAKGDPEMMGAASVGSTGESGRRSPITNPHELVIKGDPVQMEVSWDVEGKRQKCPAEQLVLNLVSGKPLVAGKWLYNGSLLTDGQFLAQREGSIVSLITDQTAMINSVAPGHENDDIWTVNTNRIPAMNTPVELTIRLISEAN